MDIFKILRIFREVFWEIVWKFLGIVWIFLKFFGIFFGIFLKDFFWRIFWRKYFGGIFWENFFGRIFRRIFCEDFFGRIVFGRILWEELFVLFQCRRHWFFFQDFGLCQDFVWKHKEGRRTKFRSLSQLIV